MPDIQVRESSPDRTKRLLAAAALLLGGILAVERLAGRGPGETPPPAVRMPPAPVPKTPQPSPETQTEFDKLVELFQEAEAAPAEANVVREFAREFRATPELQKEFDEFAEDQRGAEPKETLKGFVQALSDKPEFRALVSRFAQDPGFRQAAYRLTANPDIREAVREVLRAAQSSRPAARGRAAAGRRPTLSSGMRPASAGGTLAPGAKDGAEGAGAAPHGAAALARIPDARAGKSADVVRQEPWRSAPDAHDVNPKLGSVGPATSTPASKFCVNFPQFKPFCEGDPPHLKPEFAPIEAQIDRYGLWGACFVTGKYPACAEVCEGSARCELKEAWDSCLEAYDGDRVKCLGKCHGKSWCTVNEIAAEDTCCVAAPPGVCAPLTPIYCSPSGVKPGDAGKPGKPWYGYDVVDGKYRIDPAEREKLERIFRMRLHGPDGKGPMKVADIFNWMWNNKMRVERGDQMFAQNKVGQLLKRKDMYCGRMRGIPPLLTGSLYTEVCRLPSK